MNRRRKTYKKDYPMLNNIEWIHIKETEEERNERYEKIARMLHRFYGGKLQKGKKS